MVLFWYKVKSVHNWAVQIIDHSTARHEQLTVNLLKHFVIGRGIDGTRCNMQSAVTVNNGMMPRGVQIPVSWLLSETSQIRN